MPAIEGNSRLYSFRYKYQDPQATRGLIGAAIMPAPVATGEIEGADGKFYLDCFGRRHFRR